KISKQSACDFFRGLTVQRKKCAEPSLAETKCTANKLLYRKISHCLVQSQLKISLRSVLHKQKSPHLRAREVKNFQSPVVAMK
ncbi:MAG: hypothetical protein IJC34_08440, partial [Lentisphaeria bacterium]|nr:hypothetical protein [Lentisphaeria bacterium]